MENKSYITVTPEVLESLDKILNSGARGVHLLFSNRMIREAFARERPLELLANQDLVSQVQSALSDLLQIRELEERQQYIELLDANIRDTLVHLYFGFLDRYIVSSKSSNTPAEVLH